MFLKLIVSLTLSTTNIDLYSNLRLDSRVLILIVLLDLDALLRFPISLYKRVRVEVVSLIFVTSCGQIN